MAETFPPSTRILIVDDQSTMRDLVRMQLRSIGYGNAPELVKQASDGRSAFKMLEECLRIGLPIDLVISDWEMPGGSGIELLKRARADDRFKDLPIILLTAVNRQDQIVEAIQSGVNNYILKPFSNGVLVEKLKKTWTALELKRASAAASAAVASGPAWSPAPQGGSGSDGTEGGQGGAPPS